MSDRGVSIQFVQEFCMKNNLWEKTTGWVCYNIIRPACDAAGPDGTHCRYVELPKIDKKSVGHAKTFVSHAWGAPFGLIVAALLEGEPDMNRFVWIDIFAVLQFDPKPEGEIRFDLIIPQCSSFLLVVPYVKEFGAMDYDAAVRCGSNHDMSAVSDETFKALPMLRVWCLVEIFSAFGRPGIVLVMKVGQLQRIGDTWLLNKENNADFLKKLYWMIDVFQARATVEEDRIRILEEHKHELSKVNAKVRGLCSIGWETVEAVEDSSRALVSMAAVGDAGPHALILSEKDAKKRRVYQKACSRLGFTELLRELLHAYPIEEREKELITTAADGDQVDCIRLLLEEGFDVNAAYENGWTACINAADGGHTECLELLIEGGCDVNLADKNGSTACMWASHAGQTECLQLLLDAGCDINAVHKDGWTALDRAMDFNHPECVSLLESRGAVRGVTEKKADKRSATRPASGEGECCAMQ